MKKILTIGFVVLGSVAFAQQSTLNEIRTIFQANCTVGCHSGGSPSANLDLSGNTNSVYNALVEVTPTNPAAASSGYKLIDPGYPENSFLLKKCATVDWDSRYNLELSEGNNMPDGQPSLDKEEIELVRQWILYGAPQSGTVVNFQTLYDYYNGLGMARIQAIQTPEEEGAEGYQMRLGPFFLPPLSEVEYRWKHDLGVSGELEVYRTKAFFNDESHHFILYRFEQGANNFPDGLRPATQGEFGSLDLEQVSAWVDPLDFVLPASTAYKWEANPVLDLNYHILNYSPDSVLAAECYVNVYTQPVGTAPIKMNSVLLPINAIDALIGWGNIGDDLIIPSDGQEHTFTETFALPVQVPDWYVWQLGSHTHERGTDYDIYLRNPNGTKGQQVYEGFYDTEYNFNQGYYDWEHPPLRTFEPLMQVDMTEGFIHEAKYVNNTGSTLNWGLTTEDEMMLISVQYTEAPLVEPTSVQEGAMAEDQLVVSPNPFVDELMVSYALDREANVKLEIYNSIGAKVSGIFDQTQNQGQHNYTVSADEWGLPSGVYYLNLTINGFINTKKVIKLN